MIFYVPSTNGFYEQVGEGGAIPAGAIPISDELHAALLAGLSASYKQIVIGEDGLPELVDRPPPGPDEIWQAIKGERDRRTQQGGYQVNGFWFHSDTMSRTQQMGLKELGASIPAGVMWKTMTGDMVEMTPALAQQIFSAAVVSDIAIFAAAEAHRAAMEASPQPHLYDFSGGWPAVFGD